MNNLFKIAAVAGVIILTGCAGTKNVLVPTTKRIVVMPPSQILKCPGIPQMRVGGDLQTQSDAARNVKDLYDVAIECKGNLDATRNWLELQKEVFESSDK